MTAYEILVLDIKSDNLEGWQVVLRTNSYKEAEEALAEWLGKLGWDYVLWDWDSQVATIFFDLLTTD